MTRQERVMRKPKNGCQVPWLLLGVLFWSIGVPGNCLADEKPDEKAGEKAADKGKSDDSAKPSPVKMETPAPGLTERERWLLDQVEELRHRVAELEAKVNTGRTPSPVVPTAEAPP